jgi:hypothetical protein
VSHLTSAYELVVTSGCNWIQVRHIEAESAAAAHQRLHVME